MGSMTPLLRCYLRKTASGPILKVFIEVVRIASHSLSWLSFEYKPQRSTKLTTKADEEQQVWLYKKKAAALHG